MNQESPKNAEVRAERTRQILQNLLQEIGELPLLDMFDSVKTIPSPEPQSIEVIREDAEDLIDRLEVLSLIGQEEAITALRDLGNRVAEVLFRISKPVDDEKSLSGFPSAKFDFQATYSLTTPVVRLTGDFSKINEILSRDMDALLDSGLLNSDKPLNLVVGAKPNDDFIVDVIDSLHWRNDLAAKVRDALTKSAEAAHLPRDVFLDHPLERLHLIVARAATLNFIEESEMPQIKAEAAVHDWIRQELELRLTRLCREHGPIALARVASRSMKWPTVAAAPAEEEKYTIAYVNDLRLGETFPFRLAQKKGGGRGRNFQPGAPARFALDTCLALEEVRLKYRRSSRGELNKIRKKANQISDHKLPTIREAKEALQKGTVVPMLDPMRRQIAFDQRWGFAAALLPEFPRSNKSKPSSGAFQKWLDAAKLHAEAQCKGDWENYPWWPQCVLKRTGGDNRPRSMREAVGEKLRMGMLSLQD